MFIIHSINRTIYRRVSAEKEDAMKARTMQGKSSNSTRELSADASAKKETKKPKKSVEKAQKSPREKKPLNVAIGKRISRARLAAGHTQEWLAESVGVSLQYISDLERGVVGTSVATLINLCNALNVSIDSLLFEPKESPDLTPILHRLSDFTDEDVQRLCRMLDLAQIVLHYREYAELNER